MLVTETASHLPPPNSRDPQWSAAGGVIPVGEDSVACTTLAQAVADCAWTSRPEDAEVLRAMTGISQEYSRAIADDSSGKQIEVRIVGLRKVCRFVLDKG